jgi:hypothetical protein
MVERNAGLPPDRRIEFRVGIHLGDVVEESDGDLMGNGINVAARLDHVDHSTRIRARLDEIAKRLPARRDNPPITDCQRQVYNLLHRHKKARLLPERSSRAMSVLLSQ